MDKISRSYAFKNTNSGLTPTSPRSLKDLKQRELHQKAAQVADSVLQEGRQVDSFLKSMEGKPQDTNQDFPGHVTVKGARYHGLSLDGGTVRANYHPRELNGTEATVTKKNTFWFDEKTGFRVTEDGDVTRTIN